MEHSFAEALAAMTPGALAAVVLAAVLSAIALGSWLSAAWRRARLSRRARARMRRAIDGENRTESLLEKAGYTLLARQPRLSFPLLLDGNPRTVELRADWLVERGGRRFVADTKTGSRAPSLDHAPTRRQLLEYRVAYDVEGVLLIDAETDTIHEIVFPTLPPRAPSLEQTVARALLLVIATTICSFVAAFLVIGQR